jgi:hypothetical protein
VSARRAGLLTGSVLAAPAGILRDVISTGAFNLAEMPSRAVATFVDVLRAGLTGGKRSIVNDSNALFKPFQTIFKKDDLLNKLDKKSGFATAWDILRNGEDVDERLAKDYTASNFEELGNRFRAKNPFMGEDPALQFKGGTLGTLADAYVELVFRTRSAPDALSKIYAFRKGLEHEASMQAKNKFPDNKEAYKEYRKELLLKPTVLMQFKAQQYAEEMTFQNDNVIAEKTRARFADKGVNKAVETTKGIALPFTKTPTNVVLKMLDYTPIGFGSGLYEAGKLYKRSEKAVEKTRDKYYEALKADSETLSRTEQRKFIAESVNEIFTIDQQKKFATKFGRATIGSLGLYLGYTLAMAGLLTGAVQPEDDDKEENDTFWERRRRGINNASFPAGNVRITIPQTPLGNSFLLGATMYEQNQNNQAKGKGAFTSMFDTAVEVGSENIKELPQLKGSLEYLYSKQLAPSMAGGFVGTFIPSILNDWGEIIDTEARTKQTYPKKAYNAAGKEKNENARNKMAEFYKPITGRIPFIREMVNPVSTSNVPNSERGGFLRRLVRSFDPLMTRSEGIEPNVSTFNTKKTKAGKEAKEKGQSQDVIDIFDALNPEYVAGTVDDALSRNPSKAEKQAMIQALVTKRNKTKSMAAKRRYSGLIDTLNK